MKPRSILLVLVICQFLVGSNAAFYAWLSLSNSTLAMASIVTIMVFLVVRYRKVAAIEVAKGYHFAGANRRYKGGYAYLFQTTLAKLLAMYVAMAGAFVLFEKPVGGICSIVIYVATMAHFWLIYSRLRHDERLEQSEAVSA